VDDYTWQQKLKARRKKRMRETFVLLFGVVAVIGTLIWYFALYTRTAEYALKQAKESLEHGDTAKLHRYVNLPVLTSQAYDDLTVDLFAYDSTLTPESKILFEKFYVLIKPELTKGTEDAIDTRLDTGEWVLPQGTDILKGRQLGIDFERFLERSQIRNTTLAGLGNITHNGTTALAEVQIVEDYTHTPFTLQLVMEESDNGAWQITYIKNYKDYLDTIAPLQNEDIGKYIEATAKIVQDYNNEFLYQQRRFQNLMSSGSGVLSESQREAAAEMIQDEVIPVLKRRQQELDAVDVPTGAAYLARLRQQSTQLTIKTWQHYITALRTDRQREFETAETLHKQQLAIELRIEDIIKHTAVSKNIPNIP